MPKIVKKFRVTGKALASALIAAYNCSIGDLIFNFTEVMSNNLNPTKVNSLSSVMLTKNSEVQEFLYERCNNAYHSMFDFFNKVNLHLSAVHEDIPSDLILIDIQIKLPDKSKLKDVRIQNDYHYDLIFGV